MTSIATTLLIIFAVISAVGSIIGIIAFFRKPFKYRILWLFFTLIISLSLIIFLQLYDEKSKSSESPPKITSIDTNNKHPEINSRKKDSILIIKEFPNYREITQPDKAKEIKNEVKDDKNKISENDFASYINSNSQKSDIAILVFDNNIKSVNSLSSEIANLYHSQGYSVNTSLFTNIFLNSVYLNEVQTANLKVIDKLELLNYATYIVIAKYSQNFDKGELTTWICRAKLDVSIISCSLKKQIESFQIIASNGFDDQQNAEKGVKEKILKSYKTSHLNF